MSFPERLPFDALGPTPLTGAATASVISASYHPGFGAAAFSVELTVVSHLRGHVTATLWGALDGSFLDAQPLVTTPALATPGTTFSPVVDGAPYRYFFVALQARDIAELADVESVASVRILPYQGPLSDPVPRDVQMFPTSLLPAATVTWNGQIFMLPCAGAQLTLTTIVSSRAEGGVTTELVGLVRTSNLSEHEEVLYTTALQAADGAVISDTINAGPYRAVRLRHTTAAGDTNNLALRVLLAISCACACTSEGGGEAILPATVTGDHTFTGENTFTGGTLISPFVAPGSSRHDGLAVFNGDVEFGHVDNIQVQWTDVEEDPPTIVGSLAEYVTWRLTGALPGGS